MFSEHNSYPETQYLLTNLCIKVNLYQKMKKANYTTDFPDSNNKILYPCPNKEEVSLARIQQTK